MNRFSLAALAAIAALSSPGAAHAEEVFGGIYVHAVDTPLSLSSSRESGVDFSSAIAAARFSE